MPIYKFEEIAYNITEKKVPESGDEVMYIGLEHLDAGSLKVSRWGSQVKLKGQKLLMKKGDVLFGKRNTYLRRVAIAPHDGIFSAHGMIFRPKHEVINQDYFPFFISSNYFMDAAIRISVGSLSPTVNWKTLKDLEFELPTLDEQIKSASLLKSINYTKEAYEELLLQTDNLVKSQFIEIFGDPILNDKNWATKPLKKVAPKVNAEIPQSDSYWSLNLDMIETYTGKLLEKVKEPAENIGNSTYPFDNTMVLYSKLRPYLNKVFVPDDFGFATTELVGMRPNEEELNKYFLFNLLRSDSFVNYAMKNSSGAQMPRMQMKLLREFQCIIPPLDLQEKFVKISSQADRTKTELRQAITNAERLVKSILFDELEDKEVKK
ncbi:restriction endonuclease subunit S [Listeria innocua]|uniref:restriction endonuclease subunit S n=1 Tax=Listeria innocua TaxID=1642 RepID=UPI003397385B